MEHLVHTSYLSAVMNRRRLKETVRSMCELAYEVMVSTEFEALAFTGMSGAGIAFPMSAELSLPVIMVRKDDGSHHYHDNRGTQQHLEGVLDATSYVIVDDQISTGNTVLTIMGRIAAYNPKARCVGIMLYNDHYNGWYTYQPWMDDALVRAGIRPLKPFAPVRVHACCESES
jgi:adenine/guanine phosphoribosyltransferase-like PRPP-binding protein